MRIQVILFAFLVTTIFMIEQPDNSATIGYEDLKCLASVSRPDFLEFYPDCASLISKLPSVKYYEKQLQWWEICQISSRHDHLFSCQVNIDVFGSDASFRDKSWLCVLKDTLVCDGTSQCATDECHCEAEVAERISRYYFYCFDGSGCITSEKLCDGLQQCKDGSDECFCPETVEIFCPLPDTTSQNKICTSPELYWTRAETISSLNCTVDSVPDKPQDQGVVHNYFNYTYECIQDILHESSARKLTNTWNSAEKYTNVSLICKNNCSDEPGSGKEEMSYFCDHVAFNLKALAIHQNMNNLIFLCEENMFYSNGQTVPIENICDGRRDCKDGADEIGCPGRFYCSNNTWIDEEKKCDNVKDCANGLDECATCDLGYLSSSQFLIRSKIILLVTSVMGLSIVFLNLYEGRQCFLGQSASKKGEIDKILRLQIFVYDGLMGCYLCCVVLAAIVLRMRGDYCIIDREWRASEYCSALGVLFSFSSHGSLIVVAFVSILRCYNCAVLVVTDVRKKVVVIVSVVIFLINSAHSIVPMLPYAFVQDIFRTEIFFSNIEDNPFFSRNPVNVSHLDRMSQNKFKYEKDLDVYEALAVLKNVTSKPQMFDTMEVSYYGNTGLCVHNIFKAQSSYKTYKLTYLAALVILLTVVVVTYSMIVLNDRKNKAAVGQSNANGDQDNNSNALTIKVALMIGTQLVGWIPLIFTTIYFYYMDIISVPPLVFEMFALVVIPINSFLNPVFNSGLYKKVIGNDWLGFLRRWFEKTTTSSLDNNQIQGVEMLQVERLCEEATTAGLDNNQNQGVEMRSH